MLAIKDLPKSPEESLLSLYILFILSERTDAGHTLTQAQLGKILRDDYDFSVSQKTVQRHVKALYEAKSFGIGGKRTTRKNANKKTREPEETFALTDLHLERDFADCELRFIISNLLFSPYIPQSNREEIVGKLASLSSTYFAGRLKHIYAGLPVLLSNKDLLLNIEVLEDAIIDRKKIRFNYSTYSTDKKLRVRCNEAGEPLEYVVSPYEMVVKKERPYLICADDSTNSVRHYRIDHLENVDMLDEPAKPYVSLKASKGAALDLPKYMQEHPYMFTGKVSTVKFRVDKGTVSAVVEEFGQAVKFIGEKDGWVTAQVRACEDDMAQFAINYARYMTILSPMRLAVQVKERLEEALRSYDNLCA